MKRFFIVFLLISIILSFSIIPVYAADTDNKITILRQPVDYYSPRKSNGYWSATFSVVAIGNDLSYQWEYLTKQGLWVNAGELSATTPTLVIKTHGTDDFKFRCKISSGSNFVYTRVVTFEEAPTSFFGIISVVLTHVTSYVSLIINSLIIPGAPLYPLFTALSIGIAVAAFLIVVKIMKGFSWGF